MLKSADILSFVAVLRADGNNCTGKTVMSKQE